MSDKIVVSLSNSQSYDVKEDKEINANILDPNYIPKFREYEAERQKNELERISNENERKDNESKRISNESSREAYVEQLKKDVASGKYKGDKGDKPVKGTDYFTQSDIDSMVSQVTEDATSEFNTNVANKTTEFNTNANNKLEEYNTNAANKIAEYDSHSEELDNKIIDTRNELERVKNDVLETGTATDTFVHLEDSAMAEYQELSVDGVCEQETTTGKNLFDIKNTTKATITTNDNTNFTYIPTANGNNDYLIDCDANTSYTISMSLSTTVGGDMYIYLLYTDNTEESAGYIRGSGTLSRNILKTSNAEKTLKGISVRAYNIVTYNNYLLSKPMLEKGTQATDYEPYTGGQPSPNPDYPQEIEVGRGKNLFDKDNANIIKTYLINDGDGTLPSDGGEKNNCVYIPCKSNTTYTIQKMEGKRFKVGYTYSMPTIGGNVYGKIGANNDTQITITTNSQAQYLIVYLRNGNVSGEITLQQALDSLQIEKGSKATSYLPYNTIEVKSTGKNLFDIKDWLSTLGATYTENSDGSITFTPISALYKTTYLIKETDRCMMSFKIKNGNGSNFRFRYVYEDGAMLETSGSGTETSEVSVATSSSVSTAHGKVIGIRGNWTIAGTFTIKECMLEQFIENVSPQPYEPYKESSITANLPEGEFIGKISDTIKDTLKVEYNEDDGQHHLKLYKNVGKVVLDGSENWQYRASYNYADRFVIDGLFPTRTKYIICNYLPNSFGLLDIYPYIENNTKQCVINFSEKGTTTLAQFKSWLSTNKPEVYCALAEPYEIDLGIVDMPITYNEITNLFTDSDLSLTINVKYYRNFISTVRNLQVNEKALKQELVDINTRLSALESAQTSVISESEVVE